MERRKITLAMSSPESQLRWITRDPDVGWRLVISGQRLIERLSDFSSIDVDWARVATLLNAESRGLHGRVCFRGSRWQGEVERPPTPAVAVGPDPSAMRFDDRLADCQTHAAALWFLSKERIKFLVSFAQA